MRPTTNVYFMYLFLWVPLVGLLSVIVAFSGHIIFFCHKTQISILNISLAHLPHQTHRKIWTGPFINLTRLKVALEWQLV